MNDINLKAILTPLFGLAATWLATKLNFLGIDQATWTTMVSAAGFGIVAAVLGLFTKTSNVLDTAGAQPGTTVVTTKLMADSLPNNNDVIAVTPQIANAIANATPPSPNAVPKT
jgi:hypothetical protein